MAKKPTADEAANHATTRDLLTLGMRNLGQHLTQSADASQIESIIEMLQKLAKLRDSLPPKIE